MSGHRTELFRLSINQSELNLVFSLFRTWSRCPDRECNKCYFYYNSCEMAGKHQIYVNSFVSISTSFLKRVAYYFRASPKTITQSLLRCADLSLAPSHNSSLLPPSILSYPETHKWWLCRSLVSSDIKNLCNQCHLCSFDMTTALCKQEKTFWAWNCLHQSRKFIILRS